MRSIASEFNSQCPGFDALRLALALAILAFHSWTITHGSPAGIARLPMAAAGLILPMFFAMSGFLVAASLARAGSLRGFGVLRLSRLLPGLLVTVSVTALLLGPLLSEDGWLDYFSSPAVAAYFGNTMGIPTFGLPGLFSHNPRPAIVNGSLWTIRMELVCYLLLTPLLHQRLRARAVCYLLALALGLWTLWRLHPLWLGWFNPALAYPFLAGAILYYARQAVPVRAAWAVALGGLALLLSWAKQDPAAIALPAAYVTVWLGLARTPRLPGDYAYGLYLAGYPVAQTVVLLLPHAGWWQILFLSTALALGFAVPLWHGVEKPLMAWRRRMAARRPILALGDGMLILPALHRRRA